MESGFKKFWRDILTEKDGHTYELQRVFFFCSLVISVLAFLWGCTLETFHVLYTDHHDFDMPSFFEAIAYLLVAETVLLGGGGASIFMKMKSERAGGGSQSSTISAVSVTQRTEGEGQ